MNTNPFAAAISLLRGFLGVRTLNGVPFDGASLVPALNVLEAAGKLQESRTTEAMWGLWQAAIALPDQAKEKP